MIDVTMARQKRETVEKYRSAIMTRCDTALDYCGASRQTGNCTLVTMAIKSPPCKSVNRTHLQCAIACSSSLLNQCSQYGRHRTQALTHFAAHFDTYSPFTGEMFINPVNVAQLCNSMLQPKTIKGTENAVREHLRMPSLATICMGICMLEVQEVETHAEKVISPSQFP